MEKFKTINGNYTAQIVEKKSKFIANIYNIENKEEAEIKIKEIKKKYFDAKHNCFAYITFDEKNSIIEKCSDDGEPSGTAGGPLLNIIKNMELCNVLIIVTRYFGGILLGTGGLVRAYSESAMEALKISEFVEMEQGEEIKIKLDYSDIDKFKYYVRKEKIKILKEEYSDGVEIFIEISKKKLEDLKNFLDTLKNNTTKVEKIQEKYIKNTF